MQVGMTLPVTEPGWSREILLGWVQRIDQGPFSSLALGERIAFVNPELFTTLGACAALSERVPLVATVVILPMHNPVLVAKQLATIDLFSNGRLTVGVGVGGREEDYLSIGADFSQRRLAVLAESVTTLRRVWAGEQVVEAMLRPVEPFPVQTGGPDILAGMTGPKSIQHSSQWSDGLMGFSFGADPAEISHSFELTNAAWLQHQRKGRPRLLTSFWFALGDDAKHQRDTHLRRYLNWLDPALVEALIEDAGFVGSAKQLKDKLEEIAALGADEVILVPTSIDPKQLDVVAEIASDFNKS